MKRLVFFFLSSRDELCWDLTERATLRQAAHFNIELHSNTAVARLGYHLALDVAAIREAVLLPGVLGKDRFGNETRGVVGHSCSCGELVQPPSQYWDASYVVV